MARGRCSGWGVAAFFVLLWHRTGNPVAWFTAQGLGWGRHLEWPWTSLANTWTIITDSRRTSSDWRWQAAGDLVIAVVWAGLTLLLARRRLWPEFTLSALTLATVITSTYYLSVTRSSLCVFPLMMACGAGLRRSPAALRVTSLALSGAWMSAVAATFAMGLWSG